MSPNEIKSYGEFWPYYVAEHSKPATRALHFAGTITATTCLVLLFVFGKWYWFPLSFVPGYGAAWIAHFFIEHNRPATFKYPLWSFISDYKMVGLMLVGKMKDEVVRVTSNRP